MAKYTVNTSSYDSFKAATTGKRFDVDGCYGAQCWDGAALLWQQLGRNLSTGGTGSARGCWEVESARKTNAGSDFELIPEPKNIKRGDVVVFGKNFSTHGHICFADMDYPKSGKLKCFGQNQDGTQGVKGNFKVCEYGTSCLIGAFRFKKWVSAAKPVVPAPATLVTNVATLVKTVSTTAFKVGDKVKIKQSAGKYSRSTVTIPSQYKVKNYTVLQIGKDDVLIKELFSWVKISDLTKA
jgi:hypothetical protein